MRRALIFIAAIGLLLLSLLIDVRTTRHGVDPVTGARIHQTQWFFVFNSTPVIEASPLESWMQINSIPHQPQWDFTHGTGFNIWGMTGKRSNGGAPPIYSLTPDQLQRFIDHASDDQIADFVQAMRFGTETDQEQAVLDAVDIMLP